MNQNHLVEKLTLQAESFQDGFETLIRCNSFEEIMKNFWHLLRGNFLVSNIHLLFKPSFNSKWKFISSEDSSENIDQSLLNHDEHLMIKYFSDEKYNVAIVLPLSDSSFLGILIGHKLDNSGLTAFDKITLQILLQVFSSAYNSFIKQQKEKKLIFELNEKILQLNNLINTGIELSRYEKQSILYELALERAVSITNASSALLSIVNVVGNQAEKIFTFPKNISVENILNNPYRVESSFKFNNKTYRFVLSEKETRKGVVLFNDLDKLLLQAISRQVRASIENEYLLGQSFEKERIEKELSLAAEIQQRIIPKKLPDIEEYQLAGINIPSREVGGDYYDCIKLDNGKFAFIIADVAGKGIAAALLVNTLNAAMYSYIESNYPLSELASKLNKLIFKLSPDERYITFFIAVLNCKSGDLNLVNAGHNPALLLRRNGTLELIKASGFAFGLIDSEISYTEKNLILESGDKIFLYTDGIPEAKNLNEEEYSDERMIEFFKKHSDVSPEDFIKLIVQEVKNFVEEAQQSDDITALFIKRN